jgi:hypothetical protein
MTPYFSQILETLGAGGGRRSSICHCPIWIFHQDKIVSVLTAKYTMLKLNRYLSVIFSVWYHQQHAYYQHIKFYNKYLHFIKTKFTCCHKKTHIWNVSTTLHRCFETHPAYQSFPAADDTCNWQRNGVWIIKCNKIMITECSASNQLWYCSAWNNGQSQPNV